MSDLKAGYEEVKYQGQAWKADALSPQNVLCLKGILAIGILLHHLYQRSGILNETIIGYGLQAIGYWIVGCFFFLSGYGLIKSAQSKGEKYIRQLPSQRIVPFFLVLVVLTILYAIERFVLFRDIDVFMACKSLLFGHTIIVNGWYLQVQLLLYIVFFLVFYRGVCIKREGILLLCTLIYMLACYYSGLSSTWYTTSILFPLGVFFGSTAYDNHIISTKRWALITAASLFVCLATYYVQSKIDYLMVKAVLLSISTIHFVLFAVFSLQIIPVQYKVTTWLGSISLEIYVLQGLFLNLFSSDITGISNPYFYVVLVSCCTIGTATVTHPVFRAILNLGKNWNKNNMENVEV